MWSNGKSDVERLIRKIVEFCRSNVGYNEVSEYVCKLLGAHGLYINPSRIVAIDCYEDAVDIHLDNGKQVSIDRRGVSIV